MGIEFEKNRVVRLFLCTGNSKGSGTPANTSYRFKLPEETSPGTYRKFTLSMNVNGEISCYVDGNALYCCDSSGTATTNTKYNALEWMTANNHSTDINEFFNQATPLRIGGDYRSNNTWYLHYLKVKSMAMYKDASADTTALVPMFYYDLTDTSVSGCFSDLSGNDNDAIYSVEYDSSNDYDYAFAVIGDTQYMTRWDVVKLGGAVNSSQHLKKVYDWILANKDKKNIQYVMGLGDITDSYNKSYSTHTSDTAAEWAWAYSQISRLDGQVPYSVVRGNHDNETYFDSYFANDTYKSQFTDPDGYSCFFEEGSVRNAYNKFEVGTEKYILLLLDDNPTDAVLEWAGDVISRNKDHRVIINTHTYLGYTGDHIDDSEIYAYATKNVDDGENNGEQIWEKLVSKHENIVLVLSGHDYKSTNILRTVRIGDNGNAVNEMLICPQSLDKDKNVVHKAGMVAMLYFSNGGKDVRVEYVSTHDTSISENGEDVYYKPEVNNTNLLFMTAPEKAKYGYVYPEYLDIDKYPFAVFSEKGTFLGGFEHLMDCASPYDNEGAVYRAKAYLDSNSWNGTSYGDNPKSAVILLRKDYALLSNESYNNMSHIKSIMTIDLDGHTLIANDAKAVFPTTLKPLSSTADFASEVDVINGKLKIGSKAMISLAGSNGSAGIDVSVKPFTYSFTNVEFIAEATTNSLIAAYSSSVEANPTLIFNDCVFDLTNAPSGAVLFDLGNGYVNSKATVNGGKIISNASADFVLSKNVASADRFTFGKTENGNYTALTVPSGVELPVTSVNGGELVFVKISENSAEGTETYRLRPESISDFTYTPKMSITLESQLVLNVYIPVNSTEKFTFNDDPYENLVEIENKIVTIDGKNYYHFAVALGAAEAAKEIRLVATVAIGEETATATFTFSIPKYASKVIANGNDTEKQLATDVLAYIRAAYNYEGFKSFNTADEITRVNTLIDSIIGEYTATPVSNGVTNVVAPVTSVTLNLDAKPTIRFYVSDTTVEFFADGKKLNTVSGTDETYGTYVELDVYAYALCETITYTGGGSYHISDFVNGAVGTDHEALVKAFVKYTESAADYRASVIGSNK